MSIDGQGPPRHPDRAGRLREVVRAARRGQVHLHRRPPREQDRDQDRRRARSSASRSSSVNTAEPSRARPVAPGSASASARTPSARSSPSREGTVLTSSVAGRLTSNAEELRRTRTWVSVSTSRLRQVVVAPALPTSSRSRAPRRRSRVVFTTAALEAFVTKAQPVGGVIEVEIVDDAPAKADKPAKTANAEKASQRPRRLTRPTSPPRPDKPAKAEKPAKANKLPRPTSPPRLTRPRVWWTLPRPPTVATAPTRLPPSRTAPRRRASRSRATKDSMKFHVPGSRWYDATVAEVWFRTADAAEAAGFVPAGGAAAQEP